MVGIEEKITGTGNLIIMPISLKIGTRPKVLLTSTFRISLLKDESGGWMHGHTQEELDEYKTLKVDEKFLSNYSLTFNDRPSVFDLDTEKGRFDVKVINWFIKNGKTGKYNRINYFVTDAKHASSETLYIVYDEIKVAQTKVVDSKIKFKAMTAFNGMTSAQWLDYLHLIGTNMDLRSVSPDIAEARIIEYIDASVDNAKRFIEWSNNEKGATQNLIDFRYALEHRVIKMASTGAYYYGEVLIGVSEDAAIAYLNNAKQSTMKSEILNRTARARGIIVEDKEPTTKK
jgi:hypothetical protein